tara:strand:- start:1036 stop:1293 length:258 start_codon:yes stop_codon:yes gene_type:complete
MANEMEVKVQHLLNHLNNSYESMKTVTQDIDFLNDDEITSKYATLVAIGLAKNYVAYLNGDFETISEATANAMATAQKDLVLEEE